MKVTNPTYRQLLDWLKTMSDEQLDMNVSIYNQDIDEFYEFSEVVDPACGVLDHKHPYLVTPNYEE